MKQTPTFASRLLTKNLFSEDSPACSKRSRAPAILHMAMSLSVSSSSHWEKAALYHRWVKVRSSILNTPNKVLVQSVKQVIFLLVYNSVFHNVLLVNWKTWAEGRAPLWCTWTSTSLLCGCGPRTEQRALSESLNPTYAPFPNRSFPFLVYFHRWAKGKKAFKPAHISNMIEQQIFHSCCFMWLFSICATMGLSLVINCACTQDSVKL